MKTIIKYSFLILFFFGFVACEDLTEVDFPKNQLAGEVIFQDEATTESAMANLYAKLRDRGTLSGSFFGVPYLMGNYADDLVYYGTSANDFDAFFTNSVTPVNETLYNIWKDTYNQIYEANRVIEGMQENSFLPESFKNQIEAEALFVRSLLHFNLSNLFGDIPYCTTTDYEINSIVSRQDVDLVYELAILDLEMALDKIGATERALERIYPNKVAIQSILARIYAYRSDWDAVLNYTTSIISNPEYSINPNLDSVFNKDNPSTIWQLHTGASNQNTAEANTYYISSTPPTFSALSEELITSFDFNDLRRTFWIDSISDSASNIWYYSTKYKQRDGSLAMEYSIQLRLEEIYLLHAEASAQLGDYNASQLALNTIRNRSGLPDTLANNLETILLAIEQEKRFEFFCEGAHRWHDLKRWGRLDDIIAPLKPNWNTTDELLPIPEKELLANENLLPQNPGY